MIEKLNNLLDETTILNFRLISKLMLRYKNYLYFSILVFSIAVTYVYLSQPKIYTSTMHFKNMGKHTISSDLSELLPVENTGLITINELNVTLTSHSFIKEFARLVFQDKNFKILNFGSISDGKNYYGIEVLNKCNNLKNCVEDTISNHLPQMFSLEQGQTDNRFLLNISALDEKTALILSNVLAKVIEQDRIVARKYLVTKEIDSVESLLKESKSILEKMDGYSLLEENEKIQTELLELKERSRALQSAINAETATLSLLEARVLENKKNIESVSKLDRLSRAQESALRKKIEDVRQNIAMLSSTTEDLRSKSDTIILENLKMELKSLESKKTNIQDKTFTDEFGKQQEQVENSYEFELSVTKKKISKMQNEHEDVKRQIESISKDKISKDAVVTKLKSDLDFLKTLENKLMSLKLISSTLTSDLIFEEGLNQAREFRRSSFIKIFAFTFFMVFFSYIIAILFRYFTDDKIYSEEDLQVYFKNIDFIGEVPNFD